MKSLIIPTITPARLPADKKLPTILHARKVIVHGAEETSWEEDMIDWVPQDFHDSCRRLLGTFAGRASGILVWWTTGEGIGLWSLQYLVLLSAMQQACPDNTLLYAGVLGGDTMVADQVRSAQSLGINNVVLGLNHTWNNIARFQAAMWALWTSGRLFLYNLPTFDPAEKDFILSCLEDPRVVWFKDSSGNPKFFSWLLSLKKEHPDFQVFHGSEPGYGELSDEELAIVDGLVSGNANVHPSLLHEFAKNPRNAAVAQGRSELHKQIIWLSWRTGCTPVGGIEQHIHGLKNRLATLCVSPSDQKIKILSLGQEALLSYPNGSLFKTYQG